MVATALSGCGTDMMRWVRYGDQPSRVSGTTRVIRGEVVEMNLDIEISKRGGFYPNV